MKKSIFYFVVAALAMVSCSEEELVNVNLSQGNKVLTASFEQDASATRMDIATSDNALTWSVGDEIAVISNDGYQNCYILSSGEGTTNGVFTLNIDEDESKIEGVKAVFPYTDVNDDGTICLSETLDYSSESVTTRKCDLPMLGAIENGNIAFKHLAGVLKVNLSNIPAGYNTLTVTASNPISGNFAITTTDGVSVLTSESTEDAYKKVTVTFAETTEDSNDEVLYLPLPVGTYESIVVSISGEDKEAKVLKNWANKTVARAKVYSTSVTDYTSVMTEAELKAAVVNNTEVKLGANITLTDAITINKTVTIDLNGYTIENKTANNTTQLGNAADECIVFYVVGAEANLTLNATNGGKVIATGDGSTSYYNTAVWVTNGAMTTINGGEYSNTADPENDGCDLIYGRDGGKIYVTGGTFKAGAIRSNLGDGIYGVLNCKDTKGSLITVSGGKFYEYGAAEAAKVGKGEVILLEGGYYWSAKDAEGYYTVTDKIETEEALKSAIANTGNVTLGANITLTDAITINRTVTIDLNGYTIENKSAANTTKLGSVADECIVFYVDGAQANLTLNATNGGKVIATGDGTTSYYNTAVWVTNGATATINGGEYSNTADPTNDGCDLIYGRDGGKIYITGGTFKAGAIRSNLGDGIYGVLNCKDTKGSLITVSGGKFYEYGAAEAAKVGKGEVILLEGGYYWSAKDAEGYYRVTDKIETEEALKSAIVAGVTNITLAANITLEKAITIPTDITAIIDLNGYDVTAPNTDAFEVAGTLTINGTDESVVSAGTANPNASVCAVWANGGNVTINGGHYKVYSDAAGKRNDCIYAGYNADNNNTAGTVTINGGKFEYVWPTPKNSGTDYNGDMFLLNCADKDLYKTLITVNGGQFQNNVPSYEPTTPKDRQGSEVQLGVDKKVYNGEIEVKAAHNGTADVWYEVR